MTSTELGWGSQGKRFPVEPRLRGCKGGFQQFYHVPLPQKLARVTQQILPAYHLMSPRIPNDGRRLQSNSNKSKFAPEHPNDLKKELEFLLGDHEIPPYLL